MHMALEEKKTPPRRTVPLKHQGEPQARHPGAYYIWKRLRDHRDHWSYMTKLGANESLGSHLGLLFMKGELTEHQADAGRLVARFCAKFDHYMGMPRREMASPAYEKGAINSRNDEEALAVLKGTIADFERRSKAARRSWDRLLGYVGDDKVWSLIMDVCVHDRACPHHQVATLRAALEVIVLKMNLHRVRSDDDPAPGQPKKRRFRKPSEPRKKRKEAGGKDGHE